MGNSLDPRRSFVPWAALDSGVDALSEDRLPEQTRYIDDGCEFSSRCQDCPLPACRYDMAPGQARALREAAQLKRLLDDGLTINQAAAAIGVSQRTIYRLRRTYLDQAPRRTRSAPLPPLEPQTVMVDGRFACVRCRWAPKMIHPSVAFIETPAGLVCRGTEQCEMLRVV